MLFGEFSAHIFATMSLTIPTTYRDNYDKNNEYVLTSNFEFDATQLLTLI